MNTDAILSIMNDKGMYLEGQKNMSYMANDCLTKTQGCR